jgi:hypothetical protein
MRRWSYHLTAVLSTKASKMSGFVPPDNVSCQIFEHRYQEEMFC